MEGHARIMAVCLFEARRNFFHTSITPSAILPFVISDIQKSKSKVNSLCRKVTFGIANKQVTSKLQAAFQRRLRPRGTSELRRRTLCQHGARSGLHLRVLSPRSPGATASRTLSDSQRRWSPDRPDPLPFSHAGVAGANSYNGEEGVCGEGGQIPLIPTVDWSGMGSTATHCQQTTCLFL